MRIIFLGIFLLLVIHSYAQKSSQKAANDICECVESKLPNTEQQHMKDSVNQCFGNAMAVHMEGLNKEFKVKSITVESVRDTRDKLLEILRKECIYFNE